MGKEKKDRAAVELRVDDPGAAGAIRNRMRLLTLPADREEYDRLAAAMKQFDNGNKPKEEDVSLPAQG